VSIIAYACSLQCRCVQRGGGFFLYQGVGAFAVMTIASVLLFAGLSLKVSVGTAAVPPPVLANAKVVHGQY
jgi:hypothetical protein